MKDKYTERKLKNVELVHHCVMEKLADNDDLEVDELIKIRDKLGETLSQLDFWLGRDNNQRFYEELKSHTSWVIKNYKKYLKNT